MEGEKKKPIKIDGGQVQLGGNTRKQRLVVIRMQIFFFFVWSFQSVIDYSNKCDKVKSFIINLFARDY